MTTRLSLQPTNHRVSDYEEEEVLHNDDDEENETLSS